MSGRENNSSRGERLFRKLTVLSVFLFVLFQFGIFIVKIAQYSPHIAVEQQIVHDTVYITETVSERQSSARPGKPGQIGPSPSYSKPGTSTENNKKSAHPDMESEKHKPESTAPDEWGKRSGMQTLAKGDSRWKWDVVELNSADSSALDELPGIGRYYAKSILRYREKLGAFTEPEQLLEIRGMDSARFARLAPRVRIDSSYIRWIELSTVSEETLASHPYVGKMAARGIVRLRESLPPEEFSLEAVIRNGIMSAEAASRLARYLMK